MTKLIQIDAAKLLGAKIIAGSTSKTPSAVGVAKPPTTVGISKPRP